MDWITPFIPSDWTTRWSTSDSQFYLTHSGGMVLHASEQDLDLNQHSVPLWWFSSPRSPFAQSGALLSGFVLKLSDSPLPDFAAAIALAAQMQGLIHRAEARLAQASATPGLWTWYPLEGYAKHIPPAPSSLFQTVQVPEPLPEPLAAGVAVLRRSPHMVRLENPLHGLTCTVPASYHARLDLMKKWLSPS